MCDMDMGTDCDMDTDLNSEISNEIDESFDFESLESVDNIEWEAMIDAADSVDDLNDIKGFLMNNELIDICEEDGGDSPKVLTRDITPEILESRERDTNEVLDNYRDNLRGYGVREDRIEEYINQEQEKINVEYESLDQGDTLSNLYPQPENWEEIAVSLLDRDLVESEQLRSEVQEQDINYDEIYEDIQQEALEQGFEEVQIDSDPERLENSLRNFDESVWESFSLEEQKSTMAELADYVVDIIGFDTPPTIEYYNNAREGEFGGYDVATNTLHVNEYMLYNSNEAADTIAHELWHAHQHECAMNPQNARDYQYQYNFENYIPPSLGQEAYEEQLVEAEARAFAAQFKDRLDLIKGRAR